MKFLFLFNKKLFFLIIINSLFFLTILKGQTYTVTASWPQFGISPCSSYRVDLQGSCGTTFSTCCISSGLSLPSVGQVYTWTGTHLATTGVNAYGNAYQNLALPDGSPPPCLAASCTAPTSAGSISASDVCGTNVLVSGTAASGGTSPYEYRFWVNGTYVTSWSTSTSATVTLPAGTTNNTIIRYARATCSSNTGISTSIIYVDAVSNYTNGGTIVGNEENCNSFNPTTITSTASASGGNGGTTEYQWQSSTNGSTWSDISGATSATYNPSTITATRYYRRKARRSPCTSYVYSNTITKTIIGEPNIPNITISNEICNNNNGSITLYFTNNPNRTTIAFSINGGATYPYSSPDNAGSYTITGLSAGTYNLYVRWGGYDDCPVSLSNKIINNSGNLTVTTTSDTTLCGSEPKNLTLTATAINGTTPYTYTWDNGLGIGQSHVISPTSTTTYTCTVTDNGGCSITKQVNVRIKDNPLVTVTSSNPNCAANNGTITFSFANNPTETQLKFSFDGGITYQTPVADNTGSVTYFNRSAGIYELYTRWGNDDCPIYLGSVTLSNNQNLKAAVTAADYVCIGNSTILNAVAVNGVTPYNFTWLNGVGNTASVTVSPNVTTTYTVRLIDGNGCVTFETVSLFADPCGEVCNNGIDDDGDGLIDCDDYQCKPKIQGGIVSD